jgi:predicted RNase H-like HicB family nuclease
MEEIPDALSQGKTIAKLKENLLNAARMLLETDGELLKRNVPSKLPTLPSFL